jgi:hypothetical protein
MALYSFNIQLSIRLLLDLVAGRLGWIPGPRGTFVLFATNLARADLQRIVGCGL